LGPSEGETSFQVSSGGSFFPRGYFNLVAQTEGKPLVMQTEGKLTVTQTEGKHLVTQTEGTELRESPSLSFTLFKNPISKHRSVLVATSWFLFFGFDLP
jgi:hypothetical protein